MDYRAPRGRRSIPPNALFPSLQFSIALLIAMEEGDGVFT